MWLQHLLILWLISPIFTSSCNEREFKTGKVCVCSLKSCDEIEPYGVVLGQAALYTTSKTGKRLERTVVYPTDNEPLGTLHMTIDTTKKHQQIKGFGGTFTDASGANLQALPDALAQLIIKQYYSPDQMGYTLGRVPIASNDFSTHVYSYDDIMNDYDLTHFSLTTEDTVWKIPYIKQALQYVPELKLLAVPWSAPGWMKDTHLMNGSGKLTGLAGDQVHKAYANYFVRFLQDYKSRGVNFWAVSAQNEPTNGNVKNFKPQSTYFTAETERDFIKDDLGPAIRSFSDNIAILLMNDNRNNLPKWADTVLKDSSASKYIGGIGVTAYDDSASSNKLDETNKKHPDLFILGTEASSGYKTKDVKPLLGSWARAEDYATDILQDLNNFVTGWIERNLVLDYEGGPNWAGTNCDAPIIAFHNTSEFFKQPTWYSLAHFSHFIQPGAYRIDHSFNVIEEYVKSAAFLNPDGSKVVVLLNQGGIAEVSHTVVVQDKSDNYNRYKFPLGTNSITTLYINSKNL